MAEVGQTAGIVALQLHQQPGAPITAINRGHPLPNLSLPHRLLTASPIRVTISLSIAAGVAKFSRANPA